MTTQPTTTKPATRKAPADLSKDIPGLELDAKVIEPGAEWRKPERTVKRTPKPRSAQQQMLDAQAADLHKRWIAADKPRDMDASPKAEYHVAPEHLDAMLAMLRKTVGAGGPAAIRNKSVKIRQATMQSGKIAVTVAVWDRLES